MLTLGQSDSLSIYQGEDALIHLATHESRDKSYYQVKYTTNQWKPNQLDDLFIRATETLSEDDRSSYAFCTNVSQSAAIKAKFDEINQKFGKPSDTGNQIDRLRYQVWVLDSEDPTDKIQSGIRSVIKGRFAPRKIGIVLTDEDVERCRDQLLSLEARFKLVEKASVTGKEVWEEAGLRELAGRIPALILGERLLTWESWVRLALEADTEPLLLATRDVMASNVITLDLEDRIFELAEEWAKSPDTSRVYLITGASGVGKTWLLLRLGLRLSSLLPTYWADEISVGRDPVLSSLSEWEGKPTVLLIDNVIEGEWGPFIPASLRSAPPVLVIGTTAATKNEEFYRLKERAGQRFKEFPLGPLLNSAEISRLAVILRNGIVSNEEQKQLESSNIRQAVRVLTNQRNEKDLTDRLFSVWRKDDCQPWVMPLLLCSSLRIKIPKSLLRNHARRRVSARREFPDDLAQLVLKARREDDEEEQVWLEDADLARKVLTAIEHEIGKSQLEKTLRREAEVFSESIEPASSVHRRFARRIIREFCSSYPAYRVLFFAAWEHKIAALLPFEARPAIAYVWLDYLTQIERQVEAGRAVEKFVAGGPQSVADVILLIESFGNERARKLLESSLSGAEPWHLGPWDGFIEYLRPLDDRAKRELLALAIPFLQNAPLNLNRLLDTRNLAVDLITLVQGYGEPEHREWLLTVLNAALPIEPTTESLRRAHVFTNYLPLVHRCIMQGRSGIVLVTIQNLFNAAQSRTPIQELYGTTYDLYRSAYDEEQVKSHHLEALERAFSHVRAESAPTKAGYIWPTLVDFASKWAPPLRFNEIEDEAYRFLQSMMDRNLPSKLFEALFLSCGRKLLKRGNASLERLQTLLRFFDNTSKKHASLQLLVSLAGTVIKQESLTDDVLINKGRSLIKAFATGGREERTYLANDFIRTLAERVDSRPPHQVTIPDVLPHPVMVGLFYCIGNVPLNSAEQRQLSGAIYGYWSEKKNANRQGVVNLPFLLQKTILTLFQLHAYEHSKAVIAEFLESDPTDPDVLLLAASWEARYGSPELSETYVIAALQSYLTIKKGAHPPQIRRAYLDLAQRSSSPKREILELCAELQRERPLRPIVTIIEGGI